MAETVARRFAVKVANSRSVQVLAAGPADQLPLVFHTGTPAGLVLCLNGGGPFSPPSPVRAPTFSLLAPIAK